MTRRRVSAAMIIVVLALAGCSRGGDGSRGPVKLDGSPRHPDTAGVIDKVSKTSVTIDGKRYKIEDTLQAFSTSTLQPVPILGRVKQYVQAGTSGERVYWLAVFGAAATLPGRGTITFYTGELKAIDGNDLVFKDGTVLRVGSGVSVPPNAKGRRVNAEIDVKNDRVRALLVAAAI